MASFWGRFWGTCLRPEGLACMCRGPIRVGNGKQRPSASIWTLAQHCSPKTRDFRQIWNFGIFACGAPYWAMPQYGARVGTESTDSCFWLSSAPRRPMMMVGSAFESWDRVLKNGRNFHRQHLRNFYQQQLKVSFSPQKWRFHQISGPEISTPEISGGNKNSIFGKFRSRRCILHLDLIS